MKNLFVVGIDNNNLDKILLRFNKKKIINTVGALVTSKHKKKSIKYFIEKDLYNVKLLSNYFNKFATLDLKQIQKYENYELVFYKMIDRVAMSNFSIIELSNLYRHLLSGFIYYFKNNKIDIIIFESTPHFPLQLLIYGVCKNLNIKIIIIQRTDLDSLYILKKDLYLKNIYKNNNLSNVAIEKKLKFYFSNDIKSFWNIRSDKINNYSLSNHSKNKFHKLITLIIYSLKTLISEIYISNIEANFYLKNTNFFSRLNSKIKLIRLNQIINTHISDISVMPDLNCKFIYFALHFQPERSTMPEGRVFTDQFLAIKILSESLPEGFKIYVKEHPRQIGLFPDLRRFSFRNKNYYNEINGLKNVFFVNTFFPSDKLLNHASINSTITGSIGINSIRKKIPVIVFAKTWYSNSDMCKIVTSVDECRKSISSLMKISKSKKDFYANRFIKNISNYLVISNLHNKNKKITAMIWRII